MRVSLGWVIAKERERKVNFYSLYGYIFALATQTHRNERKLLFKAAKWKQKFLISIIERFLASVPCVLAKKYFLWVSEKKKRYKRKSMTIYNYFNIVTFRLRVTSQYHNFHSSTIIQCFALGKEQKKT
jgi:hypothetical protein